VYKKVIVKVFAGKLFVISENIDNAGLRKIEYSIADKIEVEPFMLRVNDDKGKGIFTCNKEFVKENYNALRTEMFTLDYDNNYTELLDEAIEAEKLGG
jgi:hypothetical protein